MMERAPFLRRTKSDSFSRGYKEDGLLLPLVSEKKRIRIRSLLGHCLYRRVIIWTVAGVLLLCLAFSTSGVSISRGRIRTLVDFGQREDKLKSTAREREQFILMINEAIESASGAGGSSIEREEERIEPEWLKFKQ